MSITKRYYEFIEENKEKEATEYFNRKYDLGVSAVKDELAKKELTHDQLLNLAATFYVGAQEYQRILAEAQEALDYAEDFLIELSELKKDADRSIQEFLHGIPSMIAKAKLRGRESYSKSIAQMGARAMLANDPRQTEKKFIKECWKDWRSGKSQYKSKAAFARDMMSKVEHLTSAKKIEDWCREWEKETATQQVK